MPTPLLKFALATVVLVATAFAQERGLWRAAGNTAKSITGDIALGDDRLSINFLTFTISRIRPLENSELSAAFDADATAPGTGSLYRLNVPGSRKFLHKNSLCGNDDVQWMATYVSGRTLELAFFSSDKPPLLTLEALANSSTLCGTFAYVK